MASPYIGEIRMFAGSFAPVGWDFCSGQLLAISDFDALFNLIGTTYGGDGQNTFALPDLSSRVPIHVGNGFTLAQNGGVESVTLTVQQIPIHSHALVASSDDASVAAAAGNILSQTPTYTPYISGSPLNQALAANSLASDGGSQPHSNIQPYLCISFIISLFGIFPSPT